jgi:hypothetical protein
LADIEIDNDVHYFLQIMEIKFKHTEAGFNFKRVFQNLVKAKGYIPRHVLRLCTA